MKDDIAVQIYEVEISEHPNADALEIANVLGYQSLVQKGVYETGDLVAYIPEASVVPDDVIEEMGLTGRLAGSKKNRVKAIRLRGTLSQGLIYPITGEKLKDLELVAGDDVTEDMGIFKYEPPIPEGMSGEVHAMPGMTATFKVENIKNFPGIFTETDNVDVSEKLHGTYVAFGNHGGEWSVNSKGLGRKGLAFKLGEENDGNIYVQMFRLLKENLDELNKALRFADSWFIMGEIFGQGVQDLAYGEESKQFAAFDIYAGNRFMDTMDFDVQARNAGFNRVPHLYRGKFSEEMVRTYTSGQSTWDGAEDQIREGIVIKSIMEEYSPQIGRKLLKSISPHYLLRKSGTEFN